MGFKLYFFIFLFCLWSFQALSGPLCSVVFRHDFERDKFADLRHQGAFDMGMRLNFKWLKSKKPLPHIHSMSKYTSEREYLPLSEIHFMQAHVIDSFSDSKYSVIGNARALRDGQMDVHQMPPIKVWRDFSGKVWTLDHRRLVSMILAGKVESAPVLWASPGEVQKQSFKMSNLDEGNSTLLTIKGTQALLVERPERKDSRGLVDVIASANIPQYKEHMWPEAILQTRYDPSKEIELEAPISEFLYTRSEASSSRALNWAREIKDGKLLPEDLFPLRVWRDSLQRLWTMDNDKLAALRMISYPLRLKMRLATQEELASEGAIVDNQAGGLIYLIRVSSEKALRVY